LGGADGTHGQNDGGNRQGKQFGFEFHKTNFLLKEVKRMTDRWHARCGPEKKKTQSVLRVGNLHPGEVKTGVRKIAHSRCTGARIYP
jgi:hypothetical protein